MMQVNVSCECSPVVDARYDEGDESPTMAIVEALAEATGTDPTDLPPLADFVESDALDTLFDQHDSETDGYAVLSFTVEDWNIFVRDDGRIRICDATRQTEPTPVFEPTPA